MGQKCDFQGWVTKFNVRCSDGRTIKPEAFSEMNGKTVPLVYQHSHDNIEDVLGHVLLENRNEGVWGYGFLNGSPKAKVAKTAVQHKDITSFSIYANKLKQVGGDVVHGIIREVSLVLAGANPEAKIVDYDFAHMEDGEGEAVIYYGEEGILMDNELKHAEGENSEGGKTVQDVFNSFTEEQKKVVYFLIGQALEDAGAGGEAEQSDEEGEDSMKHNVFDNDQPQGEVLSHAEFVTIIEEAKKNGSLKEAFEAHHAEILSHAIDGQNDEITEEYGIHNLDYLFPDYRTMEKLPQWIKNEDDWVVSWLNGTKKNPFSRIKMVYADITMDEARAKGYVKGTEKKEEVFKLLKRVISPTTIYKKQKFDRDDLIDITDIDVIAWVKAEMRMMLNNEIALAELLGDGREPEDPDKINETNLIPVIKDDPFYTISAVAERTDIYDSETGKVDATAFVDYVVEKLIEYKGTGAPNMYITRSFLNRLLLARDMLGHRLWKTKGELATEMGVNSIIEVEQINGRVDDNDNELLAIIVNPKDYVTGADKGGAINMFDDFDIDFNQYKYLMETRISGGLTKPKSAIAIYVKPETKGGNG